jgi:pantetheine-phosphate adenylyltransferase
MAKIALFPGSFDPFHKGHKHIVDVALQLFDEVYVCVAVNPNKKGWFEPKARVSMIEGIFKNEPRVKVISTDGLVFKKAQEVGALFIIKGARNGNDFVDEVTQADINMKLGSIQTIVIPTPNTLSYISSTVIRSVLQASHGNSMLIENMMP